MRVNSSGKAFYHPVTHQLIQPGQFYDGAAYLPHENEPVEEIGANATVANEVAAGVAKETVQKAREADVEVIDGIAKLVDEDIKKPGK